MKKKIKKKLRYGVIRDKILILIMLGLISVFSIIVVFIIDIVKNAPKVSPKRLYRTTATILYDENDNEFARLGVEKRENVTYDELPQVLIDAIIATEDSRFFQHDGIDIARFAKASIGQVFGHSDAGGGSTITMQVSKIAATTSERHGIEGIKRKFTDIYLSVFVLEKRYTKEQILEFYVNIPELGAHSFGVKQAAKNYFGKDISDLNLVEAATLAGLFQAPTAYNPYAHPVAAENRRNTVLNLMYRHGFITEEERDAAKSIPIQSILTEQAPLQNDYQDFIDTLTDDVIAQTAALGYNNGKGLNPATTSMKIYTTLRQEKQKVVDGVMSGETYNWKNDSVQAGIAVIDVESGALVAVGASRDPNALVFNYAASSEMRRHPGSTAKPIVDYGPAFEYLNWSPSQTVIDEELEYLYGWGVVKNHDNKYNGIMTAKEALATSRNVPALLTFRQTTYDQKLTFAKNLGWDLETDGYGNILETCSIGGFDATNPLMSAAAYATFARGGRYIEPYTYLRIELVDTGEVIKRKKVERQAMSEETAYLITDILRYAVTSGQISAAKVDGVETAAKTGTSTVPSSSAQAAGIKGNIIGDAWLNTYSSDYAISLWYGYRNKIDKSGYLTTTEGYAERKNIIRILAKGIFEQGAVFEQPRGIVEAEVELYTDPLELASPYTPSELRQKALFKKGSVPETMSERFSQLSNPSNLKAVNNNGSITLTWNKAKTPNAIDIDYLTNYFASSTIYSWFGDKYLNERIDYNNRNIGDFGYEIYIKNGKQLIDLGFTTDNTFTYNGTITSQTKFVVKSSYRIFKRNQSSGLTVTVDPNINTDTPSTNPLEIEYKGNSCSTVNDYNNLGSSTRDKIKVVYSGEDVTSKATISEPLCKDTNDSVINCNTMENGKKYSVTFTVRYNSLSLNKKINLLENCN